MFEMVNFDVFVCEICFVKMYSEGCGMIVVNVMKVVSVYVDYVWVVCDEGVDVIVMGVGLLFDLFDFMYGYDIVLILILLDSCGIVLVLKKWMKKGCLFDVIVIEYLVYVGGYFGVM